MDRANDARRRGREGAHLAAVVGGGQENFSLKVGRQQRVNGQHLERRRVVTDGREALLYVVPRGLDVLGASHENKNISGGLAQVNLQRLFHCCLHIIFLRRLGEHDIHGERAPRDLEHWHTAEKICEFGGVERGGGDDELEVIATGHNFAQDAKQHVGVEGALVGLVHNDAGVGVEVPLLQRLAQKDAVCHVLDQRFLTVLVGLVLKANGVAHLLPNFAPHFLRDSLGDSDSRDATGLWRGREARTALPGAACAFT